MAKLKRAVQIEGNKISEAIKSWIDTVLVSTWMKFLPELLRAVAAIRKSVPSSLHFFFLFCAEKSLNNCAIFSYFLRRETEEIEPKPKRNRWCLRCERSFQVLDSCSFVEVLCICIKFSSCLFLCVRQRPNQDQTRLSQQNFAENHSNKFGLSKVKEQRRRKLLQWRFKRVTRILLCVNVVFILSRFSPALIAKLCIFSVTIAFKLGRES